MITPTYSVTFFQEGAVRLIRSAKKVSLKACTLKTGIGTFTHNGSDVMSHDVVTEPREVSRKLVLEPYQYLNMPSRSQMRTMGIHGKNAPQQWAKLSVEAKLNAHLADLAHDFGATSWEYSELD